MCDETNFCKFYEKILRKNYNKSLVSVNTQIKIDLRKTDLCGSSWENVAYIPIDRTSVIFLSIALHNGLPSTRVYRPLGAFVTTFGSCKDAVDVLQPNVINFFFVINLCHWLLYHWMVPLMNSKMNTLLSKAKLCSTFCTVCIVYHKLIFLPNFAKDTTTVSWKRLLKVAKQAIHLDDKWGRLRCWAQLFYSTRSS